MGFQKLSPDEIVLLGGWILAISLTFIWAFTRRDRLASFSPPVFLIAFNLYYCIVGPLQDVFTGKTVYRGLDLRTELSGTWDAALLSFCITVLCFILAKVNPKAPQRKLSISDAQAWKLGFRLNTLSLLLYFMVVGAGIIDLINPFGVGESVSQGIYRGSFSNYFTYSINLLIPGISLMWISWLKKNRNPLPLLAWLLIAFGIFTSLGFRYRLALLAGSFYIIYHIIRLRRPNLVITLILCILLILGAGYVGASRNYGRGLDLTSVQNKTVTDLLNTGLSESNIFWTSAGVLQVTPKEYPYVGFTPIVNTLLFPIPKSLIPDKHENNHYLGVIETIYGSKLFAVGAFFMCWAEWYLMAGWLGLILGSAIFGWLYRWLWEWFRTRRNDPLGIAFYVNAVCFQYVIFSRGYMPQQALLFCFTILPTWLIYRWRVTQTSDKSNSIKSAL
jgi:oligosaccharide repeat unit polymerase